MITIQVIGNQAFSSNVDEVHPRQNITNAHHVPVLVCIKNIKYCRSSNNKLARNLVHNSTELFTKKTYSTLCKWHRADKNIIKSMVKNECKHVQ